MDMNRDALEGGVASSYRKLIDIGIALSAERDYARLMELILLETKEFTGADAGTLYLNNEDRELTFQIVRNDTLGIAYGGTTGAEIKFRPVPLLTPDGKPNLNNVASCSAITFSSLTYFDNNLATFPYARGCVLDLRKTPSGADDSASEPKLT